MITPRPPPDSPAGPSGGRAGGRSPGPDVPSGAPVYATVAPLSLADARRTVRRVVRRHVRRARDVRTGCARQTRFDATCRPAWRDRRFRYRGTMFVWSGERGVGSSFTGTRARRACHRGADACVAPVRWRP